MMYSVDKLQDGCVERARNIKIVLSDNDGVLTDACVYYSQEGELLKRFNMRDGMGFDRLRKEAKLACGIVTKEKTAFTLRRGEKLNLEIVRTGIDEKVSEIEKILSAEGYSWEQLAYIGDDVNDYAVLKKAGLAACPADALPSVIEVCHLKTKATGGNGAFRAFAEFILAAKGF